MSGIVKRICQAWVDAGMGDETFWEGWPECPTPEDHLTPSMVLSALTEDPRAMVAAALEEAAEVARDDDGHFTLWGEHKNSVVSQKTAEIASQAIRALIDTDHAAALEAVRAEARAEERDACAAFGYQVCAETRHVTLGDKVAATIRARGEANER